MGFFLVGFFLFVFRLCFGMYWFQESSCAVLSIVDLSGAVFMFMYNVMH